MGFESSQVARRRLAALAATNGRIQEALAPSQFPGLSASAKGSPLGPRADRPDATSVPASSAALVQHLDHLAHDIMTTPGAGGALIAAYAAQARALSMVVEAARRAGTGPMPASVIAAVQEALAAPSPFPRPMAG
ncbi:hypothetical protein [Gemmatimonas sp.]|uniref:hypothetical protein n=1 Tax=Gemmatimonas sp. TaxID=1962908 RepID=UPI0022C01E95|nr:hypothetical protein [Gemmatimonas sp.]MCZ8204646.1 hypothetical protein [Gemmatimonas sp.]